MKSGRSLGILDSRYSALLEQPGLKPPGRFCSEPDSALELRRFAFDL